ncbi:MAG: thermostable hemolysin [Caulobacter sp.]|nr:thermostable hemolysin [Caulobacter sp.]
MARQNSFEGVGRGRRHSWHGAGVRPCVNGDAALLNATATEDNAIPRRGDRAARRLRRLTADQPLNIAVHSPHQADRPRVEAFLEASYAMAFEGRIRSHYPTLVSVQGLDGQVLAAVGFRLACQEGLFLEQYLDVPIEQALANRMGLEIQRREIAEIGNLASSSAPATLLLFLALAAHLADEGCTHAVATATRQLRRSFARVGFATESLTRAEPARLADAAADWGAYYARDPEVRVGAIAPALPALSRMMLTEPAAIGLTPPEPGQAGLVEAVR